MEVVGALCEIFWLVYGGGNFQWEMFKIRMALRKQLKQGFNGRPKHCYRVTWANSHILNEDNNCRPDMIQLLEMTRIELNIDNDLVDSNTLFYINLKIAAIYVRVALTCLPAHVYSHRTLNIGI